MLEQLRYFSIDYQKICGKKKIRILYAWINRTTMGILLYRIDRGMYLTLGAAWQTIRILFSPLLNVFQSYTNCDIHYKADIGPGLSILHSSIGIVVSGKTRIGRNLTLTGGNVLGIRSSDDIFHIGDNCTLGANAVILAPVVIGNNVTVGACALVLRSFSDNTILGGVPAKQLN